MPFCWIRCLEAGTYRINNDFYSDQVMTNVYPLMSPVKNYIIGSYWDYSILTWWLIRSHGMNIRMLWGIRVGFLLISFLNPQTHPSLAVVLTTKSIMMSWYENALCITFCCDGIKANTWTNVDYHQGDPVAFWGHNQRKNWRYHSVKQDWKLCFSNCIQISQGPNELVPFID